MSWNKQSQVSWEWYPCSFDLKKSVKNKDIYINLAPTIKLTNPANVFFFKFIFLAKFVGQTFGYFVFNTNGKRFHIFRRNGLELA